MDRIGGITILRQNFYVSQCRKPSSGNPTVSEKNYGFKKFYERKGGITFFRQKTFGLTVPKIFVCIPSMFHKVWVIERYYAYLGYHNFQSKLFCLTGPNSSYGKLLVFH